MSTVVTLDQPSLSLEAGAQATVQVTIRNDSDVVEEYALRVVGAPESWAEVVPGRISLYPGQDTTAAVTFRPPRSSSILAGNFVFGIHVLPTEHPEDAMLPEGAVEVLPFLETTGELMPKISRGKRGATHHVAVDNWGNAPLTVKLAGSDPAEQLKIAFDAPDLNVAPGTVGFSGVEVRPVQTMWRGIRTACPFIVTATQPGGPSLQFDGTHFQNPVLPLRIISTLLVILLLAVTAAVAWKVVVQSVEESSPDRPRALAAAPVYDVAGFLPARPTDSVQPAE